MKTVKYIVLLIFICACNTTEKGYWITNVNIINVKSGEVLKNHSMHIINDTIADIKEAKIAKSKKNIDGKGGYVVPGLWDMHTHLDLVDSLSVPLFLVNGVTGVRDMGGSIDFIKRLKSSNNNLIPEIKAAGTIVESPQFLNLIQLFLGEIKKSRVAFSSNQNAQKLVDSLINQGSDFIKIRTSENQEAFTKLAKATKTRNVKFTGHIAPNQDILKVVKSGLSSIEHTDFFGILKLTEEQKEKLALELANTNVHYTPTLIATFKSRLTPKKDLYEYATDSLNKMTLYRKYLSPKLIENWLIEYEMAKLEGTLDWDSMSKIFFDFGKKLSHNDINILAGTDVGVGLVIPGKSLHQELKLMVTNLNISNLNALQAATINATNYLGIKNQGQILKGYKANFLLLKENPLEDISNTSKIKIVFKNGRPYHKKERDEILKKLASTIKEENSNYNYKKLKNVKNNIINFVNRKK